MNQSSSLTNNTLFCQLNHTTELWEGVTFSYVPIVQNGLDFSVNSSGMLRIYANQSSLGIFSTTLIVTDNASCPLNDTELYTFEVLDLNEPPYLVRNIQSVSFTAGSTLSLLFLSDYFRDHENDPLTFSFASTSSSYNINVNLNPTTSEVVISSAEDVCEEIDIYFTATDTGNLSANSNMVTLESVCSADASPVSGGGGSSGRCEPEWMCQSWGACNPNGTRSRECIDMHGCDIDNLKRTFYELCVYEPTCYDGVLNQDEEDIDCGGVCPPCIPKITCSDGLQNQGETGIDCGGPCNECADDSTCYDGVKNQDEIGIDCGGVCPVCKEIQIPGIIETQGNRFLSISLIIFLIITALLLLYLIFRKEVKSALARLNWLLIRKKRKQVLLSDSNKDMLLRKIRALEDKFALQKSPSQAGDVFKSESELVQGIVALNREYLVKAFNLDLEFNEEDLKNRAERIILHDSLKNIIYSFMRKQLILETSKILVSRLHLRLMIEELKTLIRGTSNYYAGDYYSVAKEEQVTGIPLAKTVALLHNTLVSLEFEEVELAKKRYLNILGIYEQLDEKHKSLVYEDIYRLYNYVKYVLAWA
jgi:hypothetical protein